MPALLRETYARVVRALEALRDGDCELAGHVLDDLADDLWRALTGERRRSV